MKKLLFLVIVIILGLLQVTALNYFRIFLVKPDLLLASVVIATICSVSLWWALLFSILIGILKDILSLHAFGLNTVLFPLWSILIIKLLRKISIETDLMRAVLISIVVILNDIILRLVYLSTGIAVSSGIFLRTLILESLYTAFVSPVLFKLIRPSLAK